MKIYSEYKKVDDAALVIKVVDEPVVVVE